MAASHQVNTTIKQMMASTARGGLGSRWLWMGGKRGGWVFTCRSAAKLKRPSKKLEMCGALVLDGCISWVDTSTTNQTMVSAMEGALKRRCGRAERLGGGVNCGSVAEFNDENMRDGRTIGLGWPPSYQVTQQSNKILVSALEGALARRCNWAERVGGSSLFESRRP
jgi:hypothetical protein